MNATTSRQLLRHARSLRGKKRGAKVEKRKPKDIILYLVLVRVLCLDSHALASEQLVVLIVNLLVLQDPDLGKSPEVF